MTISSPIEQGCVDLSSHYGAISIKGPDAQSFLQGQFTADIRQITEEKFKLSAYCNQKGRVRALFKIFCFKEQYILLLPKQILDHLIIQLKKYAKFSKVVINNISDKYTQLGFLLNTPFDETLVSKIIPNFKNAHFQAYQIITVNNISLLFIPGELHRVLMFGESKDISLLIDNFKPLITLDFNAWLMADIRAGIPEIWQETTELFLPHSLNLPELNAVSFRKGCYCGQEIIARMEYRGKVKKKLLHGSMPFDRLLAPGTALNGIAPEKEVATIVSACQATPNTLEMLVEAAFKENIDIESVVIDGVALPLTLKPSQIR